MRQATPLVCIESIVNRAQKIETKLEDDLKQMYKLLSNITVDAESTRADLECIRRSLTLHRLFHIGERDAENRDLDRRDALDPGSIILKIVRTHSIKLWKVLCKFRFSLPFFFFNLNGCITNYLGSHQ